ncbi:MAG: FecR domain-containing protein [Verrucomicrobia bacterium]|nr:FecR domain-containing protein [Verrucomicrobiota bacterium]MDA1069647.1 FecR domain-containing protein [Verrucomicrobiota bacterium]
MKHIPSEFDENSPIEIAASEWLARLDRGLTPEEQDSYTEWLGKNEAHRKAMSRYQNDWDDFDRLAGIQLKHHARIDPDLLAPEKMPDQKGKKLIRNILAFSAVPMAAIIALVFYINLSKPKEPSGLKLKPAIELLARIEQRTLKDGSLIEINRGAEVEVAYSASERRIFLRKGEANFDVAKDPNRPFIVNVAGVDVRAVGTIFSVRLSEDEVDVIVTEGKVNVKPTVPQPSPDTPITDAFLEIGQRAKVKLHNESLVVEVTSINETEIKEVHRWQPRLLDYDQIQLGEIVKEFNRSNPIQVVLSDPSLETISLSSSFWSDNVEGFVRLMESSFGMEAEWRGSREIVLREAQ